MTRWEVDVEVRLVRTFQFNGTDDEEGARAAAWLLATGDVNPSSFLKWTDGRSVHRPMPVEQRVDNDPQIVAVREVDVGEST